MKKLIENARWMDAVVWFIIMAFLWLVYETVFLENPLKSAVILRSVLVWGLAAIGFAILSGFFAEWAKKNRNESP